MKHYLAPEHFRILDILSKRAGGGTIWGYWKKMTWHCTICDCRLKSGTEFAGGFNEHGFSHLKDSGLLVFL